MDVKSPKVSIVILNYQHPEIINICLRTLQITEGVSYEVVVVDNGSDPSVRAELQQHKDEGRIDTLVLEDVNHYFSEGNNVGVRHTNPSSEYILMLNSDVGFMRPDWLEKLVGWAEGTTAYKPSVWDLQPTQPRPGKRDIVSLGWSHDANINPGHARPEGWCCLINRSVWQDISPDFPFLYGFEEMVANAMRAGATCGVLSQYNSYLTHREGGSGKGQDFANNRVPDLTAWYEGLLVETLDFTLDCPEICAGPNEHDTYLVW